MQGSEEGEISETGVSEVEEYTKNTIYRDVKRIYHANNSRTKFLADKLAMLYSPKETLQDARLNERSFGIYEGLNQKEVGESTGFVKDDYQGRFVWRPPRGESHKDLLERVWPFVTELKAKSQDSTTICVTSGAVIRVIKMRQLGLTLEEMYFMKIKNLDSFVI